MTAASASDNASSETEQAFERHHPCTRTAQGSSSRVRRRLKPQRSASNQWPPHLEEPARCSGRQSPLADPNSNPGATVTPRTQHSSHTFHSSVTSLCTFGSRRQNNLYSPQSLISSPLGNPEAPRGDSFLHLQCNRRPTDHLHRHRSLQTQPARKTTLSTLKNTFEEHFCV